MNFEAYYASLPPIEQYIDGEVSTPAQSLNVWIHNPNTGEPLVQQRQTSPQDLELALACSARVFASGVWSDISPLARAEVLEQIADRLQSQVEALALADAATTGATLTFTRRTAAIAPLAFRGAARKLREGALEQPLPGPAGPVALRHAPLGPAAIITPWNAPAPIAAHKLASALAAGCPVLLKPSEFAPHSSQWLMRAILDSALPPGVFQLVHGDGRTGAALVADPRVKAVSFTGGLVAGRAIARACAEQLKPHQLELGGNNPLIVLPDAALDRVVEGVVSGLTTLNGQWCRALGRLLVHRPLLEPLLERVLARLRPLRLGHSLDPASELGPLVHRGHWALVQAQVAQRVAQGGVCHSSSQLPPGKGYFMAPTLITGCSPADTSDEIFGPVAVVHAFDDESEAIRLANDSPFGLAAYLFGQDETRLWDVARRLRAGTIKLNGVSLTALNPDAPRPAWGLSGVGDEGTLATLRFFCGTQVIGVVPE